MSFRPHGILQVIKNDHERLFSHHTNYVNSQGDPAAQRHWSNLLTWGLARHAYGEEFVIHPLFVVHLPNGKEIARSDKEAHQALKGRLAEVEGLEPGSPRHVALLQEIIDEFRPHTKEEEQEDLPALEAKITVEASNIAALIFTRIITHFVPSDSFPTLTHLLTAPTDKVKAAFDNIPSDDRLTAVETKSQN